MSAMTPGGLLEHHYLGWRHALRQEIRDRKWSLQHRLALLPETIVRAIVWRLPHSIIMWAVCRAAAHATQGEWSTQELHTVTVLQVLERWLPKVHGKNRDIVP